MTKKAARSARAPKTASGRKPAARAPASARVRDEWRARIAAEYGSAAITQHLVLWLIQIGASPDVIDAGLVIVGDELVHSRLSHEVYLDAGGVEPPNIDRDSLQLGRRLHVPLEHDVLRAVVRFFCLGETVAVPLFSHLRERCTVKSARTALDRILRDEVRHRDFGWMALDWLATTPMAEAIPTLLEAELPGMFGDLERSYGTGNPAAMDEPSAIMADTDREWGLAPPPEYAEILHRTFTRDYQPRFAARGVDATPAWGARLATTP
ncbi:MAG: ferritin-like domain-containing protein [Kofleriaceae bacterium]|nr:ferritin-like domain-containing protein [Kofleriaceae bacterium]MCB9571344.1 ferritin-like domain-containing protein [Kofleriaceae bacterium]